MTILSLLSISIKYIQLVFFSFSFNLVCAATFCDHRVDANSRVKLAPINALPPLVFNLSRVKLAPINALPPLVFNLSRVKLAPINALPPLVFNLVCATTLWSH